MDDQEWLATRQRLLACADRLRWTITQVQLDSAASGDAMEQASTWLRASTPLASPMDESNRRGRDRRKGNPVSVLFAVGDNQTSPIHGWVLDRTPDGLGLLLDDPIDIGCVVSIRPTSNSPHSTSPARWVQAIVTSCREERQSYRVGCRFLQQIKWDELHLFG